MPLYSFGQNGVGFTFTQIDEVNKELVSNIRDRMALKSTEELRQIYDAHDEAEWTPEAFEAIRQILSEREEQVAPYQSSDQDVTPSIPARPRRRWLRWVMLGILVLLVIGLVDYFIIFPISRAKSGLTKGDVFVTQGNLPDAARAYGSVLAQYPWFTNTQQHDASRRILALFASMKPEDGPAVRDALTFILRANKLGPSPMIERSDPTSLLLYFDNGLDRSVDVFVDGHLAQSVPAKALRKYAYQVNGALRIETRETGKPTVIESFETQFRPGGMPCLEMKGCKELFISGGVPPAQYVYNIASKNSYKLQFNQYTKSDVAFLFTPNTIGPTFGLREDPNLGNARLFLVPYSVDYMLDEPVPTKIEMPPQESKTLQRESLVRH